jgi:hypothetical protein
MCIELSTEGVAELFSAYVKAQAEMGEVLKTATNPAFRTKYADLAAVVEAILPALSKNGLALIQAPGFDGEVVTVETMIAHSGGGFLRSTIRLRPTKSDPQGLGSAITYGRRYALMAMAGVAPEDDDGNAASSRPESGQEPARFKPATAAPKTLTLAERADKLIKAMQAHAGDAQAVSKVYAQGSALCAELDLKDPERLAEVEFIFKGLMAQQEIFA